MKPDLRLECLRLAVQSFGPVNNPGGTDIILARAATFHVYVTTGQPGSGEPSGMRPGAHDGPPPELSRRGSG